jgi:hypothetical protein
MKLFECVFTNDEIEVRLNLNETLVLMSSKKTYLIAKEFKFDCGKKKLLQLRLTRKIDLPLQILLGKRVYNFLPQN